MEGVYWKKTRSSVQVDPKKFRLGMTVWADGPTGREERFCTGPSELPLTRQEFKRWKEDRASENRRKNRYRPVREKSAHGAFTGAGLGGCW